METKIGQEQVKATPGSGALVWVVTAFLGVMLLLFALFLYTGIVVLRHSRQMVDGLQQLHAQVALNALELASVSNRFARLENTQHRMLQRTSAESARQQESIDVIRADVQRFGRWMSSRDDLEERLRRDMADQVRLLQEGLRRLDQSVARTEGRLEALPERGEVSDTAVARAVQPLREPAAAGDDHPMELLQRGTIEAYFTAALAEIDTLQEEAQRPPATRIVVVELPNGDRYEGEMTAGLFSGWGRYRYRNGDWYEGFFENDMMQGHGVNETARGERYIGQFRNNVRHGRGVFYRADGSRYIGDFSDGRKSGRGVWLYRAGDRYAGDVRAGQRHGKGVMLFVNGDIYQGEFREDVRTGQGAYRFADGSRYIGDFVNGRREGQGRYIYPDGSEYAGAFLAGLKHGEGYRIYPDGSRIRSFWQNDEHIRDIRE